MARKMNEILAEYNTVCARLGEAVYQAGNALPKLIQELQMKCAELQSEGAEAIAAEKATQESQNGQSDSVN